MSHPFYNLCEGGLRRFYAAAALAAVLTVLIPSSPAHAGYYRCVDDGGRVTYSNTACPAGTVKEDLDLPELEEPGEHNPPNKPSYQYLSDDSGVELELITEGYRISEKDRRYIEDGVQFLYRYYDRIFDFEKDVPVKIRVFGKQKRYMDYQDEVTDTISDAGFYSPLYRECVINGEREREEVLATIFHEASHAILTQTVPTLPLWINEGLAEYFERLEIGDGGVVIKHQDGRFYNLRYRLGNNELLTLRSYFELNDDAWRQRGLAHEEDTRSMAWSIVHYLMSTSEGQGTIFAILRDMEKTPGVSSVEIVDKDYAGGTGQLQKDWVSYLGKNPTVHVYDNL